MLRTAARALAFAFVLAAGAAAQAGELHVDDPWARASLGQVPNSAAYMILHNEGSEADRLLRAEAAVAAAVELHTHVMEGDVARMRRVDEIELPAGESVALAPGGLHVMLIGLATPLQAGETFPLTLVFERAGTLEVTVEVRAAGRESGGQGHSHGHSHGDEGDDHDHDHEEGHGHSHGHSHGQQ